VEAKLQGSSAAQATQATADSSFIREANAGNVLEVRLGNLAVGRPHFEVKQFAQRMVTDHTRMEKQWSALPQVTASRPRPWTGRRSKM